MSRDKTIVLKKADKGTTSVIACENIRFSSLFAAETSPAAKSDEKRMFPQATSVMMSKESKRNEGLALLKKRRPIINPSFNLWLKPQPEKLRS